jgi:hypothetical protein
MDLQGTKNPSLAGVLGHPRIFLDAQMVEAAGIEPASAGSLLLALHA